MYNTPVYHRILLLPLQLSYVLCKYDYFVCVSALSGLVVM